MNVIKHWLAPCFPNASNGAVPITKSKGLAPVRDPVGATARRESTFRARIGAPPSMPKTLFSTVIFNRISIGIVFATSRLCTSNVFATSRISTGSVFGTSRISTATVFGNNRFSTGTFRY